MSRKSARLLSIILSALLFITVFGTLIVSAETDYTGGDVKVGIDVSYYQKDIDWQKVKGEVDFAIIRVGYTGWGNYSINLDEKFHEYVAGAVEAGIPIGVYYYGCANSTEMAVKEAEFVLEQIGKYPATFSYPIIYDVETSPENNSVAYKIATETSKAFCETIRAAGYYPMVYSYTSYFNPYITTAEISENDFWQAHYYTSYAGLSPRELAAKAENRPSILGNYNSNISIWQCTDSAAVSGISGGVDGNISYVDYDAFIRAEGYNGFEKTVGERTATCNYEGNVNIRSGASTAFEILGTATMGDQFTLKGIYNKSWLEIEYNGASAFVHSDYYTVAPFSDESGENGENGENGGENPEENSGENNDNPGEGNSTDQGDGSVSTGGTPTAPQPEKLNFWQQISGAVTAFFVSIFNFFKELFSK